MIRTREKAVEFAIIVVIGALIGVFIANIIITVIDAVLP